MDKVIAIKNVSIDSISGKVVSLSGDSILDGYYPNWFLKLGDGFYTVEKNTKNSITLLKDVDAGHLTETTGDLIFVNREYIQKFDDCVKDTTAVPDELLNDKITLATHEVNRQAFSYLRDLYKIDFDPIKNVKNSYVLQDAVSYKVLELLFWDLSLLQESFNDYKAIKYEKNFKTALRDGLKLLLVDFNEDGEIDGDEKSKAASPVVLSR